MLGIDELDKILKTNNITYEENKYHKGYRYGEGIALRFIQPETTEQVSQILKCCNNLGIGIVPQGGNTGLVGSSTTNSNKTQILLSTTRLNLKLCEVDKESKTAKVGAGIILGNLNRELEDR